MKTKFYLTISTLFLSALMLSSCSTDDDNDGYSDAISINILDENNGKTLLGNSDVYIDNGFNFHSNSCYVTSLGRNNSLNKNTPILDNIAQIVAIETNYSYQIFKDVAIKEFPSGKLALNITADYYNVYVASPIKQEDNIVGANVKYALMSVPSYNLPEWNSCIGTLDHSNNESQEIILELPSSDFEVITSFDSENYYTLYYEQKGSKLIVSLINFKISDVFGFYIRIKNTYTYVYGKVE